MAVISPQFAPIRGRQLSQAILAVGAAIALLYFGRAFFVTLIVAITIGFLLDPVVAFFMRLRVPRALASFLVCTIALLLVYLIGLGLYSQIAGLIEDLPRYSSRINELVDVVVVQVEAAEKSTYQLVVPRRFREGEKKPPAPKPEERPKEPRKRRSAEPPMPIVEGPAPVQEVRILSERTSLFDYLYARLGSFANALFMASFVPFLVYFMLSWQEHLRRTYLQMFRGQDRHAAGRSWQGIAGMARAYVFGNFVMGLLLSLVSSVFFWAMNLPYYLLVGPLSGFLSLIPYIGLPLAMIPPFFVALPVHHKIAPYLVMGVVVGFLHLLALNLLYPKIVGSRVHLNPLAVTVALMFWGTLWGAVGLIFAIPITAGIKAVCDNVPDLQSYGKLLGD